MNLTLLEWRLALARMAQAAMRRVAEDSLDGLSKLWMEKLNTAHPRGVRRAIEAFVEEGKLPSVKDFRARAKELSPADPWTLPAEDDGPRCQAGHPFILREFTNAGGRKLGARPYCPCMDTAAAFYSHVWGATVEEA